MEKDTIIFDLDGTLLNTLGDLHAGFNYAIKKYGYKERTLDEIRTFVGNGVVKAIEKALPEKICADKLIEITNLFKEYYKEHMHELTKPYDGIVPLLHTLREKRFKTAVVSNKYDEAVKELCKYYFNDLIDVAIGESPSTRRKPTPDGVLKAVKELNSTIEKSIYIGDSDVDIQTAKNADMTCISVLWGYRNKEFLIKNGGSVFAEKPDDIIKIIEKKIYLS